MTQPTPTPDPTPAPPAPTNPPAPPAPEPPKPGPKDEPLGENGLKALQTERDARKALEKQVADLKPLADKARELDEAQKTEAQKLTERAEKAEREARDATAAALRAQVALDTGLPASLAARLHGTTAEELKADAEALKADAVTLAGKPPTAPKPDPSQGPRAPVDLDAQIKDAEAKGDVRTSIRLKNQRLMGAKPT